MLGKCTGPSTELPFPTAWEYPGEGRGVCRGEGRGARRGDPSRKFHARLPDVCLFPGHPLHLVLESCGVKTCLSFSVVLSLENMFYGPWFLFHSGRGDFWLVPRRAVVDPAFREYQSFVDFNEDPFFREPAMGAEVLVDIGDERAHRLVSAILYPKIATRKN